MNKRILDLGVRPGLILLSFLKELELGHKREGNFIAYITAINKRHCFYFQLHNYMDFGTDFREVD
jgi:hypothetical protein